MSRNRQNPQKGYTQLLDGRKLVTARAKNVDIHAKHCFEIARALKFKTTVEAIEYLERVMKYDTAVPYTRGARGGKGGLHGRRGGARKAGHRKGGVGPGRYPQKASYEFVKLIRSAMENARHQHEDVDPDELVITHLAAHRGQIRRGWIPRARGRATPSNHYQVNLEIFLEDLLADDIDEEDDF